MKIIKELKRIIYDLSPPILTKIYNLVKRKVIKTIISKPNFTNKINNWNVEKNGEKCLIIGNGPSLKDSLEKNRDFIDSHNKICVNFMPLTHDFFDLKPEFLILVDPIFWQDSSSQILSEKVKKLCDSMAKIDWGVKIIMPEKSKTQSELNNVIQNSEFLELILINDKDNKSKNNDELIYELALNKSVPNFQNVNVTAIYFALNIGFKEIYLFGCDHDWIKNIVVKKDLKLYLRDVHFYEDKMEENYNKFDFSLEDSFKLNYIIHNSYKKLNIYSKFLNAKIYNTVESSMIDEFEKIDLDNGEK